MHLRNCFFKEAYLVHATLITFVSPAPFEGLYVVLFP